MCSWLSQSLEFGGWDWWIDNYNPVWGRLIGCWVTSVGGDPTQTGCDQGGFLEEVTCRVEPGYKVNELARWRMALGWEWGPGKLGRENWSGRLSPSPKLSIWGTNKSLVPSDCKTQHSGCRKHGWRGSLCGIFNFTVTVAVGRAYGSYHQEETEAQREFSYMFKVMVARLRRELALCLGSPGQINRGTSEVWNLGWEKNVWQVKGWILHSVLSIKQVWFGLCANPRVHKRRVGDWQDLEF